MNANPFTLGHQYLAEQAAAASSVLHIFLVSEGLSLFPYEARRRLAEEGTKHLDNVILHSTEPYMISNATFPGYFQKDEDAMPGLTPRSSPLSRQSSISRSVIWERNR